MPSPLTRDAVRSYRTISPLPFTCARGGIFLLHFPSHYHAWTLSSLLPVGVRTFLHAFLHSDSPAHSAMDDSRESRCIRLDPALADRVDQVTRRRRLRENTDIYLI